MCGVRHLFWLCSHWLLGCSPVPTDWAPAGKQLRDGRKQLFSSCCIHFVLTGKDYLIGLDLVYKQKFPFN